LEPAEQSALSQALDQLWARFLPQIEERVSLLESAAAAIFANQLSTEQREAASAAAHKLAGVLGTFGLTRGTELARQLELFYSSEGGPGSNAHIAKITAELRPIVASRK
jgi:HPt (histidine-containing phosphotransfer) domain-containing protein